MWRRLISFIEKGRLFTFNLSGSWLVIFLSHEKYNPCTRLNLKTQVYEDNQLSSKIHYHQWRSQHYIIDIRDNIIDWIWDRRTNVDEICNYLNLDWFYVITQSNLFMDMWMDSGTMMIRSVLIWSIVRTLSYNFIVLHKKFKI